MNSSEIKELVEALQQFPSFANELNETNYKKASVKSFQSYYRKTMLNLIEYIKFRKNKALSEEAKKLGQAEDIFKGTRFWISMLGLFISFPAVLFVFLIGEGYDTFLYIGVGIDVVVLFLILRKIQQQPVAVRAKLDETGVIFKQVLYHVKQIEQEHLPKHSEEQPDII